MCYDNMHGPRKLKSFEAVLLRMGSGASKLHCPQAMQDVRGSLHRIFHSYHESVTRARVLSRKMEQEPLERVDVDILFGHLHGSFFLKNFQLLSLQYVMVQTSGPFIL